MIYPSLLVLKRKSVVFAVGGSGGHIFPALQIGQLMEGDVHVTYAGVGLSSNPFFPSECRRFCCISGSPLNCKKLFTFPYKTGKGIFQAGRALQALQVRCVLGFGSYHSFPVLVAALILRIPYVLIELNVFPGQVNRFLSRWAQTTFVCFPSQYTQQLRGVVMPVHYSLREEKSFSKRESLSFFALSDALPILFFFGGSQGSSFMIQLIFSTLPFFQKIVQIICVIRDTALVPFLEKCKQCDVPRYVTSFLSRNEMHMAWNIASCAVCRAGASSMREALMYDVPTLFIPDPRVKENHQSYNARYVEEIICGGLSLREKELSPQKFFSCVMQILHDRKKKQSAMRQYKKKFCTTQPFIDEALSSFL